MNAMEEAKKRALEMQLAPDNKFDFKQAAGAIGGVQIPTTYAFGLSPENVQAQSQLGQQALRTKQQAVGQTLESAMQRDQQLLQKLQMAHQTVMSEKKLALDQELAQVEKARAQASINASNASAGLAGIQTKIAGVNLEKMQKELGALSIAEKLTLPVTLTEIVDGKEVRKTTQLPMLVAREAGLDLGEAVRSQARKDQRTAEMIAPWTARGFDDTDAYVLGQQYNERVKLHMNNLTRLQGQQAKTAGRRGAAAAKTPEQLQTEAVKLAIKDLQIPLSKGGFERLQKFLILPEDTQAPAKSSDVDENTANMLRDIILKSTR